MVLKSTVSFSRLSENLKAQSWDWAVVGIIIYAPFQETQGVQAIWL